MVLLYDSIFAMRRFYLVLVNVSLTSTFPLTSFEKNEYLFKILIFLFMQSLYVVYILDAKPHTMKIFNKLEFFNETALIILSYMSIAFTGIMQNTSRLASLVAELIA